jgi:glutathione synthase/RimK-type ligase-like ATP-grasp enzyme
MGARATFLDQQQVLQSKIELTCDTEVDGRLETPDWSADLASVAAIYLRPYDTRRMGALHGSRPGAQKLRRAFAFEDVLTCWFEITPALVINRPTAMASNNSKPCQLEVIRAAGFAVPDTLVTTDPAAAAEFWEQHGEVIYKSVSGVRSIVTRLRPEHRERLQDIAHCPVQLQQYIAGVDFRVHVVGHEVFGCEISSNADDYRYPGRQGADVEVKSCSVPAEIADRCRQCATALNLPVAGLDLRRDATGTWYCFEANPSPGFSFYEEATGQPIVGDAIARLLAAAG